MESESEEEPLELDSLHKEIFELYNQHPLSEKIPEATFVSEYYIARRRRDFFRLHT